MKNAADGDGEDGEEDGNDGRGPGLAVGLVVVAPKKLSNVDCFDCVGVVVFFVIIKVVLLS
jgi:hypothetical protein